MKCVENMLSTLEGQKAPTKTRKTLKNVDFI